MANLRDEQDPTPGDPETANIEADVSTAPRAREYAFDTDEPMLGRPPAGDVE
jgi:hypothetical protein